MRKGLEYLGEARAKFLGVLDRFADVQAQNLNVHGDFSLLTRIALPVLSGKVRTAGIRVQDPRLLRLLEVLLHAGVGRPPASCCRRFISASASPPSATLSTPSATTYASSAAMACWRASTPTIAGG